MYVFLNFYFDFRVLKLSVAYVAFKIIKCYQIFIYYKYLPSVQSAPNTMLRAITSFRILPLRIMQIIQIENLGDYIKL